MKTKKIIITVATVAVAGVLTASGIAASGGWIKVKDDCTKQCTITKTEYKCGKCGTGMNTSWKWENDKMKYILYTFTCKNNNCKHTCQYKCKPN